MPTYTYSSIVGVTGCTGSNPTGPTGIMRVTGLNDDSLIANNVSFSSVGITTLSTKNTTCTGIATSNSYLGTSATLSDSMTVGGDLNVTGNLNGYKYSSSVDVSGGSSAEFSVPSWANKITVGLYDLSHSGASTSQVMARLGSGSWWTSNYNGQCFSAKGSTSYGATTTDTSYALLVRDSVTASQNICGTVIFQKCGDNYNNDCWVSSGNLAVYSSGYNNISSCRVLGTGVCSMMGIYLTTTGYSWDNGIVTVIFE